MADWTAQGGEHSGAASVCGVMSIVLAIIGALALICALITLANLADGTAVLPLQSSLAAVGLTVLAALCVVGMLAVEGRL